VRSVHATESDAWDAFLDVYGACGAPEFVWDGARTACILEAAGATVGVVRADGAAVHAPRACSPT